MGLVSMRGACSTLIDPPVRRQCKLMNCNCACSISKLNYRSTSSPIEFIMTDLLTCFRYAGLLPPFIGTARMVGGSVAEWLACWTQAQKGPGSNRSRDAVG